MSTDNVTKLFDFKNSQAKPQDVSLVNEFQKGGISFLDEAKFVDIVLKQIGPSSAADMETALKSFVHVSIDLAIGDAMKEAPKFGVKVCNIATARDVYFSDFSLRDLHGVQTLNFAAHMLVPERLVDLVARREGALIGCSFLDLCFGSAQELQTLDTDTVTPVRPDVAYGDIGWVIPSRFLDTLIDACGKLNDTLFDGALRESMLYTRT